MTSRKQNIEALLRDFQSLRRTTAFRMPAAASNMPQVTSSQWGVLTAVEQQGTSTVKDVAKGLGITSSAATQLVDGLVSGGYLTRQPSAEDRRAVVLALSKKSKSQVERIKTHALTRFLKIFEALNDREFNTYIALTQKIVRASVPSNDL